MKFCSLAGVFFCFRSHELITIETLSTGAFHSKLPPHSKRANVWWNMVVHGRGKRGQHRYDVEGNGLKLREKDACSKCAIGIEMRPICNWAHAYSVTESTVGLSHPSFSYYAMVNSATEIFNDDDDDDDTKSLPHHSSNLSVITMKIWPLCFLEDETCGQRTFLYHQYSHIPLLSNKLHKLLRKNKLLKKPQTNIHKNHHHYHHHHSTSTWDISHRVISTFWANRRAGGW